MRTLVVVGGQAGGNGQEDPACVSVSPFYIFLSGLQGLVSVALSAKAREMGMVAGLHFELPWQP